MADTPLDFQTLMRRAREGSPEATQELFERFSDRIRQVIRMRISRRLRREYDSQDFLQSTWASFFLGTPPEGVTFDNPDELLTFLVTMAYNKVAQAYRDRCHARRRSRAREERSVQDLPEDSRPDLAVRQPTPSQLAIAEEHWELLQRGQPPQVRRILEMLRAGHTHLEVAAEVDVHPKVIQRLLRKLNERFGPP